MERETLIAALHLSRFYGSRCALHDVSFSVQRGEILGLLGPNGAGKTTTMRIICGVLAPSAGRVEIAGHDLQENPKAAKRHLGYLPEQPPLYPDLSVEQFLVHCARLRLVPGSRLANAVAETLERCGLAPVRKRLIGNLSRGIQQRLGVAQAIVHAPALVVLDEPTVGLDPSQIVEIRALIAQLGADHSVILSSHILSEVQALCSRVLILHDGRLILDQALDALRTSERRSMTIALRRPPAADILRATAGVLAVESLEDGRFRIRYDLRSDCAVRIAENAAREGWELYELTPDADTLEDTYLSLTRGAARSAVRSTLGGA